MPSLARLSLPAAALALAGCATTNPRATLPAVRSQLRERADVQTTWPLTDDERAQADTAMREFLAHDLTVEHAVQIALLGNNRTPPAPLPATSQRTPPLSTMLV